MCSLSKKLGVDKASWTNLCLVAALGWTLSAVVAKGAEPFHLSLIGYQQLSDGSYRFSFRFGDIPKPHVSWPGQSDPQKKLYKIGDTIGHYQIIGFTRKISPAPDEGVATDSSELVLERIGNADEKVTVNFRLEYNLPEAKIGK
jgi:hypothetical protein